MIKIKVVCRKNQYSPDAFCIEPTIDIENYMWIEDHEKTFLNNLIPEIKRICEEMEKEQ